MNIGTRLKNERKACGLSQSTLSFIGGVQPNAQGHYEKGVRYPQADYLIRLSATAIDVLFVVTGRRTPNAVAQLPAGEEALIVSLRTMNVLDTQAVEHIIHMLAKPLQNEGRDKR